MYSFSWQFIESNRLGIPKHISYLVLVIGSTIFAFPRFGDGWFFFAVVAYPLSMIVMLEVLRHINPLIMRLQMLGYKLLEEGKGKEILDEWWESNTRNRINFLFNFLVATFLALVSLYFNANPYWTRYTDAMAVFYLGFVASEIIYLLTLIPSWLRELKKFRFLNSLEKKLIGEYDNIVDTNEMSSSSIEEIMKIHKLVLGSNSYPISGSSYIGVAVTLFLNSLPIVFEFII